MESGCLRITGLYRITEDRLPFSLKFTSLENNKKRAGVLIDFPTLTNCWRMFTSPNADGLKGIVAVPTMYLAGVLIL